MHAETTQISSSLKNDELRVYLDIQRAAHLHRFSRHDEAEAVLDSITLVGQPLSNRYQHLDTMILRMQIAASLHDDTTISRLWSAGLKEAEAIGAPHKAAQLALARLARTCDDKTRCELALRIDAFLAEKPRWHWASSFRTWQARELMRAGNLGAALELIAATVNDMRRDGCWELLWRAFVLQAEICHAQADYEPAIRALDEAAHMLKVVSATVENENERAQYLNCEEVRTLESIRERITQLVS